jgi:hypothetical protein
MTATMPALRGDVLAIAALNYIREHPEEWNQMFFICDTDACFAGRVVLLAHGLGSETDFWRNRSKILVPASGDPGDMAVVAAELLGWSPDVAGRVFYNFTNDFAVLEQLVEEAMASPQRLMLGDTVPDLT